MKGQLYIGDDMVAETVEVVSPPQSGDLVIYQGKRLRVREIAHNIEKKKLQIMCHAPLARNFSVNPAAVTPAMMDHILKVGVDGPALDPKGFLLCSERMTEDAKQAIRDRDLTQSEIDVARDILGIELDTDLETE